MPQTNRRQFLAVTSVALARYLGRPNPLGAQIVRLPDRMATSSANAATLLPTPFSPELLRTLATVAVDVARVHGAEYADIRLGDRQWLRLGLDFDGLNPDMEMATAFTFGVRVLVDGVWRFAHGTIPTKDAVAHAVRDALTTARGYATLVKDRAELAPTAVVTGEWRSPTKIDPFLVPLEDQTALLIAYSAAASRVHRGAPYAGYWRVAGLSRCFAWRQETRVFASTEGALTTQLFTRSEPSFGVSGDCGMGMVTSRIPHLFPASAGGYERVAYAGAHEEIKAVTEETVRLAALPRRTMDVGRYAVVFDGVTTAGMMAQTLGPALESDRVLGDETDASGTSYLAPPSAVFDTQLFSPLLDITGHREAPAASAAKLDDEGVECHPFPLINTGTLVDYCRSRQTTRALRRDGDRDSRSTSNGCMVAPGAESSVLVRAPHLAMKGSPTPASMDELCQEIGNGLLVREAWYASVDHQVTSVSMPLNDATVFEVAHGKIVRRVEGNGIQFGTRKLWSSIIALGDASTIREGAVELSKGYPWTPAVHTATAPACALKEVNVYSKIIRL
jgi:TldD protein